MMMPRLGVLVNNSVFRKIPAGGTKGESIRLYTESAAQLGLSTCFFRLQDVAAGGARVLAYVSTGKGYRRINIPVPPVIHNRGVYRSRTSRRQLEQLQKRGIRIYNGWNGYSKLHIHHLLMNHPDFRNHLPETSAATLRNLDNMMRRHSSLILKPDRGSVGRGILKLAKDGHAWTLTSRNPGSRGKYAGWTRLKGAPLIRRTLHRLFRARPYLIQECLPLATYNSAPFDLRVSVQRDGRGEWQVTGIVGKAAARDRFLTNVAQGGTTYPFQVLLEAYPELVLQEVRRNVEQFSLRAVEHLSLHLPHLADVGLDIGISADGTPLFIECNCRDQRYSFAKAGMQEEWKQTYSNPVAYGHYLLQQR